MVQPKGFEVQGNEDLYYLLKKSIYGLKQSLRYWYKRFDDFIASLSFQRIPYDMCVYINTTTYKGKVYLLLYVDDMLLAESPKKNLAHVKISFLYTHTFIYKKKREKNREIFCILILNKKRNDPSPWT